MLSDTAGVIHIIEGTAAARLGSVGDAVLAGQASLVPELEGEADDICAHVGFAGAVSSPRARIAATVEESTPPDMATAMVSA